MYVSALQNLAEVGTQSNCLGLGFKLFRTQEQSLCERIKHGWFLEWWLQQKFLVYDIKKWKIYSLCDIMSHPSFKNSAIFKNFFKETNF